MAQDATKSPEESAGQNGGNASPLNAPVASGDDVDPAYIDYTVMPGEESWYGWQILISGGASFLVLGLAVEAPEIGYVSLAGYLLGGPIIHTLHGSGLKGLQSLGINLLVPALSALAGFGIGAAREEGFVALGSTLIGASVGVLGALLVDSFVLAYEPVTAPDGSSFNIGLSVGLNGLSIVGQF
jgi:hypothetical protein